jgi:hypothetical protein
MRDGEFLTLDTVQIAAEARALAARIQDVLANRNDDLKGAARE